MVVIGWPATADAGTEQERMGLPLSRTVQAPHWAIPQPNFVPVSPTRSRIAQRRGMFSSASIGVAFPFIWRLYFGMCVGILDSLKLPKLMLHSKKITAPAG